MFRICSSKCQNEVKELNAFCEKLLSEKAGLMFEKNTMMKKMEEKEKRNIELIRENMDYREQIVHLEKKVKEIEPLENKIMEKDSIIAMLEDRLSIFEDEFCQYREVQERTINGLNDKLNRFRKHKKNYKNKLKEKIKENKELTQGLEECKIELSDLNYWFNEMSNCADYYASENKELKEENEKLLKDMEEVRETVGYAEWYSNQIEEQHEQIKGLEYKNHQLMERIKIMEEDKEITDNKHETLINEWIKKYKGLEEELEYKKQQYIDEFNDYDNEMRKLEDEIIDLESKFIKLEKEKRELENKEEEKEDIKNVAYNTIIELRKEINEKDASIKELSKMKEKLTLREGHLEEVNHTLLTDMSAKDDEIDELQNRIEQLEETLSIAIEEINTQVSFMEDNL